MKRLIAFFCAAVAIWFVTACSPPSPEEIDEQQRDNVGIAADKGGWKETEKAFTEGGKPFVIETTGEVKCSPKFALIPGTGETERERQESSSFTLVGIVSETDNDTLIPLAELPAPFKEKADGLKRTDFNKLVRENRRSNEAMKAICGDR